jgi:hypothetical protein
VRKRSLGVRLEARGLRGEAGDRDGRFRLLALDSGLWTLDSLGGWGPSASDVARHGSGDLAGSFLTNSGDNLAEFSAISGGFLSPASRPQLCTIPIPFRLNTEH